MTGRRTTPIRQCDCCALTIQKQWSVEIAGSLIMVCGRCKEAIEVFIERLGK